jgi:hypothetical protein
MQNVKLLQDVSAGCCAVTTSNLVYSLLSWATGLVVMVTRGSACFNFSSAGCGARCKVLFFETRCKVCWFEYFLCEEQFASSCRPHSSAGLDLDTESDAPSVFMRLVLRSYEAQVEMIAGSLVPPAMLSVRTVAWCSADWMKLWSRFFSAVVLWIMSKYSLVFKLLPTFWIMFDYSSYLKYLKKLSYILL